MHSEVRENPVHTLADVRLGRESAQSDLGMLGQVDNAYVERIIDRSLDGQGVIANSPLLPSSWAYDRYVKQYTPDVEAAKALLAKAGWTDANGDGVLEKGGQKMQFALMSSDDPAQVRVIEEIMRTLSFPDNVVLTDAGTMGMGILNLFRECDYMLVIDAMKETGHAPGTVVRLSAEDIAPNQVMHSLHDLRFVDVLQASELMGCRPEAECIGVQVADMSEIRIGLTSEVEAAIPAAADAVLAVLEERGVHAEPLEGGPAMEDLGILR